jgi:S-disulfanyl-L-cysteine oxidoreductase SoxD
MLSKTFIAGLVLLGSAAGVALAQTPPVEAKDGVYTAAAATRGQSEYAVFCANCHAEDLGGTNSGDSGAPPLKHETFMRGSTAAALFTKIKTRMPLDAPGSLKDQEVLDLLAFLLKANGFPAGTIDLPAATAELERIRIR